MQSSSLACTLQSTTGAVLYICAYVPTLVPGEVLHHLRWLEPPLSTCTGQNSRNNNSKGAGDRVLHLSVLVQRRMPCLPSAWPLQTAVHVQSDRWKSDMVGKSDKDFFATKYDTAPSSAPRQHQAAFANISHGWKRRNLLISMLRWKASA